MQNFNFGENLRIIRQAKGISQDSMAISLNISQSKYSKLERSPIVPELDLVNKIVDLLKIEPHILLSGQKIEDLVPRNGFEEKAKEVLNTPLGVGFYCILSIPFINAAYDAGRGFCDGLGTTEEVNRIVRFMAGLTAVLFAYYWLRRIRKGRG